MYKGSQILIEKNKNQFKRERDKKWHYLPKVDRVVMTQVKMAQTVGGRASSINTKYKAFCVYLKAGELNILAFKGKRNIVEKEARKLASYFNVEIVDLFERDKKGKIVDDDAYEIDSCLLLPLILLIAIILSLVISYFSG